MHIPPGFQERDPAVAYRIMREARLPTLVTATAQGLAATPLPLFLDEKKGEKGTLYGHLARANPQWKQAPAGEALVIFTGAQAYVSPSWYPSKLEHGKAVPTWNYEVVHAHGPARFFEDEASLLAVVERLSDLHEQARERPWTLADAPGDYIAKLLRGIVGVRIPITRIECARKMSQDRSARDRHGVAEGLARSELATDRKLAGRVALD
ncbi:FMN-binding negative transcriptional regulator [Sandaracinobacteroides sayramensis]|uniref:FMN-binding negative transcriptional regulator n=1 Tax=Sandaracinobacteroides sayramensis TaxID=2913411 RepID=UPI001EDC6824|nr:FMN-binding negative transcriptional regulator [Sandaracinobacteroides sayramensis]